MIEGEDQWLVSSQLDPTSESCDSLSGGVSMILADDDSAIDFDKCMTTPMSTETLAAPEADVLFLGLPGVRPPPAAPDPDDPDASS